MKKLFTVFFAICLSGSAAAQDIIVSYRDGAPADTFVIENQSCALFNAQFVIDLHTSVAGVLIDTAYGGPGSWDPLPAILTEGDATLAPVSDGDRRLEIQVNALQPDGRVAVTLDTDDSVSATEGQRVHVSGSEIAGATVQMVVGGIGTQAVFDTLGDATLVNPTCLAPSS